MPKSDVRYLGFDDAPFSFEDETTRVVGVVTRGPGYVEGVLSRELRVDGADATNVLIDLVTNSRFFPLLRVVFLNGATVGGFNIVDLDALHAATRIPVVALTRDEPDVAKVEAALRKHFVDALDRLAILSRQRPVAVQNGGFQVWATVRGATLDEATPWIAAATIRGAIPEPIRLAHLIASGTTRGESSGPA